MYLHRFPRGFPVHAARQLHWAHLSLDLIPGNRRLPCASPLAIASGQVQDPASGQSYWWNKETNQARLKALDPVDEATGLHIIRSQCYFIVFARI